MGDGIKNTLRSGYDRVRDEIGGLVEGVRAESKQREQRLLESVESLRQQVETSAEQVQTLSEKVTILTSAYERLADLWNEEWKS